MLAEVKSLMNTLNSERERLKASLDSEKCGLFNSASSQNTISLKDDLSKILKQNLDLKNRLLKIHEASNLEEVSCLDALKEKVSVCATVLDQYLNCRFQGQPYSSSLSYSSSCVSATEFFDAEDSLAEKTAIFEPGDDERDEESEVRGQLSENCGC